MPEFISQARYRSGTSRTAQRTAFLAPLDARIRRLIQEYFASTPAGSQVTLYVLQGLQRAALADFARLHRRTLGEVKQCVGLRVPILGAQMAGHDNWETYRDETTNKWPTRSRSKDWMNLGWVSRYTPHCVNAVGLRRILAAESGEQKDVTA